MKILVSGNSVIVREFSSHRNLGQLRCYRSRNKWAGGPHAFDCRAFVDPYESVAHGFSSILDHLHFKASALEVAHLLFVVVPDVVGDHGRTLDQWRKWRPRIADTLPVAFVLQDGCNVREIPEGADWLFVGGSDAWKLGPVVADIVRHDGRPVHMGRVNSIQRLSYAQTIGCASVDGMSYSAFGGRYLARALAHIETGAVQQLLIEG